jgi:hypothetical protein
VASFIKRHSALVLEHEKTAREAKEALTTSNTTHAERIHSLQKQLKEQKEQKEVVVPEVKVTSSVVDHRLEFARITSDKESAIEEKGHCEVKLEAMASVLEVAEARAREADLGLRGLIDEIHILRSANKVLQVTRTSL